MPSRVSGLVLAAGGSSRLGQPKQLLPFGGATLLDHVLDVARACPFDQLVCVLGGGAEEVRRTVDLSGVRGRGQRGLRKRVLVVDRGLAAGRRGGRARAAARRPAGRDAARAWSRCSTVAATRRWPRARYDDGRGHPFAFARSVFPALAGLHGDKGVWKLLDRGPVADVRVPGPIPPDIDTWDDYRALDR